jgi:hypothetical protein
VVIGYQGSFHKPAFHSRLAHEANRIGGFKGEAQQRVNERKLKLSKQLRAYVRTSRMANEMHA